MNSTFDIPVSVSFETLQRKLQVTREQDLESLRGLLAEAQPLIAARALYGVAYIDAKEEGAVTIDGVGFKSRILRRNLDDVERVFPYVVTLGGELQRKADGLKDLLSRYYLDVYANLALAGARQWLAERLKAAYATDGLSFMSPGSLGDWPIQEQRALFALLGDVEGTLGVTLTKSLLMIPAKSVSGIFFPTRTTFSSCQLCPRRNCPSRKAAYARDLARSYGVAE
jgi:hypothetical protein